MPSNSVPGSTEPIWIQIIFPTLPPWLSPSVCCLCFGQLSWTEHYCSNRCYHLEWLWFHPWAESDGVRVIAKCEPSDWAAKPHWEMALFPETSLCGHLLCLSVPSIFLLKDKHLLQAHSDQCCWGSKGKWKEEIRFWLQALKAAAIFCLLWHPSRSWLGAVKL